MILLPLALLSLPLAGMCLLMIGETVDSEKKFRNAAVR